MKISLIVPSFYPATVYGGPIVSTLHTCQELAKLDDIEIYVSTTNANMTSKLDVQTNKWQQFEENFFVKYYNETKINLLSLGLVFNVWRDIRQADVVHVQYMFNTTTPLALFYAKLLRKPIILSPRGALCQWCLSQGSRFKTLWLQLLIKPFSNTIVWHATAQEEKNDILTCFPNAKVEIIPNGIEFHKFQIHKDLAPQEFCNKFVAKDLQASKIIVSMGRLFKVKGFDILINAFEKILKKHPHAKLFIAGEDEGEKENLLKLIEKLNLQEKAFLVGEIKGQDKIDFLANADLFVLPSHTENFGNVYVESLAAGTPIVASKGTPWSQVEEADCGKWVNNSVEETTTAMLTLLEENREIMRSQAKQLAKQYDWPYIALKFKTIFKKII